MTAYQRGNAYERRVAEVLRRDGYAVWQTRGSKSWADLIAIKPGHVVLVQVKGGAAGLSHAQWNGLYLLARQCGAVPVVADRDGRRVRWREIIWAHHPRSTDWPSRRWTPDVVGSS